ncbi:vacuolar protein sorting/targeting protein PEP1, partial [Physocladia obscura]
MAQNHNATPRTETRRSKRRIRLFVAKDLLILFLSLTAILIVSPPPVLASIAIAFRVENGNGNGNGIGNRIANTKDNSTDLERANPLRMLDRRGFSTVPAVDGTRFETTPSLLINFDDSDNVLLVDSAGTVLLSKDEGKTWSKIPKLSQPVINIIVHPFAKGSRAFALTEGKISYYTADAGISWTEFKTDLVFTPNGGFSFHSENLDWIVYRGLEPDTSDGWFELYSEHAFYTKDSFKNSKPLLKYVSECTWTHSVKLSGKDIAGKERIICIQWDESMQKSGIIFRDPSSLRMIASENYFPNGKGNPVQFDDGTPLALGTTQSFIIVVVSAATKSERADLYSSTDGLKFSKAYFPPDASVSSQNAYTVLDSTEHRIIVDILPILSSTGQNAPYGNLYMSNSEGTQFTKSLSHTNRNANGRVDFERIETDAVSGTILVNVIENWKELETSWRKEKDVTSRISYDDGARWSLIRPPATDVNGDSWICKVGPLSEKVDLKCALHFHSRTETHNLGRTFSELAAPGIIIGVGNVGPKLVDYSGSDTFISTDGGLTWINAARGPHKYEIADTGSIIVLIPDGKDATGSILYSTKRGAQQSWQKVSVGIEGLTFWLPIATSIDSDGTSSSMLVVASDPVAKSTRPFAVIHLDFSAAQSRKCDFDPSNPGKSKDFELWNPKQVGTDGKDVCIMGEDVGYYRRKQDADCYVGRKYKHPELKRSACECTIDDYECDFGFRQDNAVDRAADLKCVRLGKSLDQPENCPAGTQYDGSSGYRKIPGNKCSGGKVLDAKTKWDCKSQGGVTKPPGNDPIIYAQPISDGIEKLFYLKDSNIILLLEKSGKKLLRSENEGVSWKPVDFFNDKYPILLVGAHDLDPQRVFIVTKSDIFFSKDRLASKPAAINTPTPYNELGVQILDFHPTEVDYLVFVGKKCTGEVICFTEVYLTLDSGNSWLNNGKPVETWVKKCIWAWDKDFGSGGHTLGKDAVFCLSFMDKNSKTGQEYLGHAGTEANPLQLILISNSGKDKDVLIPKGVLQFYVVDNVLVVLKDDGIVLNLVVSTDGKTFVETKFPPNMEFAHNAFTVLESNTNGIFLDVAQNLQKNAEYGHLFKSNSNGTDFNRIFSYSNRNEKGFVDFEKMKGIPGVILANTVLNPLDISSTNKQIASRISFDDGSTWTKLNAPKLDSLGDSISCDSDCSLHIFGKISGSDESDRLSGGKSSIHSSAYAAGVMVAVGSVGEHLEKYVDSNMFLTKDAGRTWSEIRKDAHKWAIGDHGAMIVIVNDEIVTNNYSWDYGNNWAEVQFADSLLRISSVQTEPSATSLKFIITTPHSAITIDFNPVQPRTCDKPKKSGGDFVKWSPAGDNGKDRCFLGQDLSFWRRRPDAKCHIGREFENLTDNVESCECTTNDFECDVGFYRNVENRCVLYSVDTLEPKNCKPGEVYKGSSGYRKIPLSKCNGGKDLTGKVDRICGDSDGKRGEIKVTTNFMKYLVSSYFYFNQSSTIVVSDETGRVYISKNAGLSWERPPWTESYSSVLLDPYRSGRRAYFINEDGLTQSWTDDHAENFKEFKVPTKPNRFAVQPLMTHSTESSYLIWIGEKDCESQVSPNCRSVVYVSTNSGSSWKLVTEYAQKCSFPKEPGFNKPSKDTILCQVFNVKSGDQRKMSQRTLRKLVRSTNLGVKWEMVLEFTISYATSSEYMVSAQLDTGASEMKLYSSLDSAHWVEATFEDDALIPDYGYTLLDSSSGTAFVEVFSNRERGKEYGTLYKSIDNAGSNYKISLKDVNQNSNGYTDFEKVAGIKGIGIANVVINSKE